MQPKHLKKTEVDSTLFFPKFISLTIKNAVVYFLLTLLGLAVLSYGLFHYSSQKIITSSEQQLVQAANIVNVKFASYIKNIQRDITYLAHSPFLNSFVLDEAPLKKQLLSSEYLALLKSKPDYAQIRLIGTKNSGKELIRVERLIDECVLVEAAKLQQKGNRPYYKKTIQLPRDSFFFSPIDLNREHGEVSVPYIPTLRVASPVFNEDSVFGIVIINVSLESIFQELHQLIGENFNLKILNNQGYFLLHPDKENTFSFEFGKPTSFSADFGQPFDSIYPKIKHNPFVFFRENDLLYAFQTLFYPKTDYQLLAAIGSDKITILADFYTWRYNIIVSNFVLAIVILIIILGYMRRQASELKRITSTMTHFPGPIDLEKLPTHRNDEIGQLAKQFKEMSISIDNNILKLKHAKDEVEHAIKEKEIFLEDMSHEIRNPIHSIIGMTHLLEKNNPSRHQKAFIEALKFNSNNLLLLVNDIFDYYKINSNEIKAHPEWFNLQALLQKISNSQQFSAITKNIVLSTDIDSRLNHYSIFTDPVRLTQVINNLVINALKFTPENGTVQIHAQILKMQKNEVRLELAVQDTGIGVAQDEINKIVERYYSQQTQHEGLLTEGTGLGLPIVIQMLKLLGSQLSINSNPGKGSRFYFNLEIPVKMTSTGGATVSNNLPRELLSDAHVLVMDDDELILLLYENLFKDRVSSFIKIKTIRDLAEIQESSIDILITDLYFGQKIVFEQAVNFKRVMRDHNSLLFVISGTNSSSDEIISLPHYKAQFRKPIDPPQLLESISLAFASHQFGTPDTAPFREDYDHEEPKFRRAINLLIEEWEKMILTLENVIEQQDMAGYTAIRHKLITSVRRLKLPRFETLLDLPLGKDASTLSAIFKDKVMLQMKFYIWWLKFKI